VGTIKRWLRSPPYVTTGSGPHSLVLLFNVFFQGAVFGAGQNVVPGNVNVSVPEHVAQMPCSSWPRTEHRWCTGITLRTASGVF
jgi:hypothetical protein